MKHAFLLASVIFFMGGSSKAETLLCVDEAAGGLRFVDGSWQGVRFNSGKTKYIVTQSPDDPNSYQVKEMGKSTVDHRCVRNVYSGVRSNQMTCGGLGYGMIVNFEKLRYTEIYTFGYIEDDQSGSNTPFVSAGKCSVISP